MTVIKSLIMLTSCLVILSPLRGDHYSKEENIKAGIYGGGPFYNNTKEVTESIKNSYFDTVVLWTLHVRENGDLVFNDNLIISNGKYVGRPLWPLEIAKLKHMTGNVKRVEFSIGSWGVPDFENIEQILKTEGSGSSSTLYRNFKALKQTLPFLDAINYDDESNYDVGSSVELSLMLGRLGFHISLCPYSRTYFWQEVYKQVNQQHPDLVDEVYLQTYAGGSGNQPKYWNQLFSSQFKVQVGLWSIHGGNCNSGSSPEEIKLKVQKWHQHISGAWIWLLDDIIRCDGLEGIKEYAKAIKTRKQ